MCACVRVCVRRAGGRAGGRAGWRAGGRAGERAGRMCSTLQQVNVQNIYVSDYGGIYLDTDMLILKSLDPFRVHKLTLGVSGPGEISNAIIIAQRCAPFLRMWLENYHNYIPRIWGYNSVTVGYQLYKLFPHLVHVEKEHLLRPTWKETDLIYSIHNKFYNWSQNYSFHVSGENKFKVPKNPEQLNGYNNTLGQVMRYIYFGNPKLRPIKGPPFRAMQ